MSSEYLPTQQLLVLLIEWEGERILLFLKFIIVVVFVLLRNLPVHCHHENQTLSSALQLTRFL